MGVRIGSDDVDEDNDEEAPPGGSKIKAQGPGLELTGIPVKDFPGSIEWFTCLGHLWRTQ